MGKIAALGFALVPSVGLFGCSGPESLPEAPDYGLAREALVSEAILSGQQGIEVVPGVVRDGGSSPFRVRYDVNRAVTSVRLLNPQLFAPGSDLNLYDDGTNGDQVAGDQVYTSAPLRLVPGLAQQHFSGDPRAPYGLMFLELSSEVVELGGEVTSFLAPPSIGVMDAAIPLRQVRQLGASMQATAHVFNLQSETEDVQMPLRGFGLGDLPSVTRAFYSQFGDDYDFFMLWSVDRIEATRTLATENFVSGRYFTVQHDYSGGAIFPFDNSARYGSLGRLQGIALHDQGLRGMYGAGLAHELTHQWSAHTSPNLGLQMDTSHWAFRSSVGSLVGGFQWLDNGNGTYTVNTNIGAVSAYEMAPLDRYFAGFIAAEAVPPVLVARPEVPLQEGYVVRPEEIERRVTIADIIAQHGPRSPGPATSRKDFRVAIGTVTNGRLLTAEEMTFYDILAEAAFRPLAPGEPLPLIDIGWPTLSAYFGAGTSLRGELLGPGCTTCDSALFGFERVSDWQSAVGVSLDTTRFTQGSASLGLTAQSWTELSSRRFSTSELSGVTNRLDVDLFIPATQPNPYWLGDLHLTIECPSAGLFQTWVGRQALTGKPRGGFSTLPFALPASVVNAFKSSAGDCAIKFALNVTPGTGAWLFDNLRFVP